MQLDKTKVNIIGGINCIPMQIVADLRVQQVIDIQVADILDNYGIILGDHSHVDTMERTAKPDSNRLGATHEVYDHKI